MWAKSITLEGEHVVLRPMTLDDVSGLIEASKDGALYKLFYTPIAPPDEMVSYVAERLKQQAKGLWLPFVVIDKKTQTIIGSSCYLNIAVEHKRLEIGATWYRKSFQRTGVNTECKLLLLTHAFDSLNANVVEFRTDWFNNKSRAAIARLGAKQDGVLRNHSIMATNGRVRDVVVFSIIASEWPSVRQNLEYLMRKR